MILFYAVPLSALITGGALVAAGVARRAAVWAGVAAGLVTAVVAFTVLLTFLFECASDGGSDPEAWPWSPRNQLCDGSGWEPVVLGMLALLLVPTVLITLGTWLRSRGRRGLGWIAYAGLLITPVMSGLYVSALPVYEVDDTPILHTPLLRVAQGSQAPRVCYSYGIVGEAPPDTKRHCIELERTPEALRLTAAYDEGVTEFDLEEVGKELTQDGFPVRPGATGVDGYVVTRAYTLSAAEAREGASDVGG
ncbi:MAG TPA: hypothetical protein VFX51_14255 [Solirubrobacteraceae bacterium]|nr:hypothetical protein [Solirubrobacteraceae bacterium]